MALAPLSQTLLLTEDGSALAVGAQVTIPPPVAPVFLVPASVQTDGTPQVGETLLGNLGASTGEITHRQWLFGSEVVAEGRSFDALEPGTYRYRLRAERDGLEVFSFVDVAVAAAAPSASLANTKTDYVATPAPTVAGFSAAHAALAAVMLTRGITLDPIGSRTVAQIVAAVEGKLDQAQPPAEVNVFTPRRPISAVEGDPVNTTTSAFILSGPATITEGNPSVTGSAFILTGPATITEGNPSAASAFILSGPATITEGN